MNSIIEQMLSLHGSRTPGEKKNGIKDVVQEIILCGLSRAVLSEGGMLRSHGRDG